MNTNKSVSLLLFLFALSTPGQAQTSDPLPPSTYRMPTVTVVGTLTNESQAVSQSANAITVLSGDLVRPGSITTTRELGTYLPNVTVLDANNDRTPKFSIRGLRENNFTTGDPAVGFYVDDVPYTDLNSRGLALFDVEQIEFLRGPQGTLFGANGPGGVINIVQRQPGDVWEGRGGFTYGNYNAQSYDVAVRGPIVAEKLSFGVSGLYSRRDGLVDNLANGSNPDTKDTLAGRTQLRWRATETLEFSVSLHGQKFNDGFVPTYIALAGESPFTVSRDFNGFVDTETWGLALKGSFKNDFVKVTSVSSYRNWRQNLAQDFDFSAFPAVVGFTNPDLEQFSEEIRFQSVDDTKELKWLGGLYFSDADTKGNSGSTQFFPLPAPLSFLPPPNTIRTVSDAEARTYAVFGQATYTAMEKLDLTAGVRFTYDDRSMQRSRGLENPFAGNIPFSAYSVSDSFTDLSPKVGASFRVCENAEAYASVSRGYQSGGFNPSNDSAAGSRFDSSHSWHYELGAKTKCFEDRFLANVSFFYGDYDDYQVYRFSPIDPTQAFLVNADNVVSYGAEFDASLRVIENLDLSAAFGVTQSEFNRFTDPNSGANFDGNDVNFVPEFTASVAVQYNFPFGIYARVELQALGEYALDEANTAQQSAFALLNARVGYEHEHFEIYGFARNLLDKEYVNNALDLRPAVPDLVRQPGDPMMIGIAIAGKF